MPTIPSIRTSVENKDVLVLDEHAKNGSFIRDARGRLIAYAGGFSVVFPYVTINGEKWAFRCWHSDISNSKKRYEIISNAIKKAHLPFLCDFDYIEKGINVEGTIYPTTRMRWIEGVTIKDYICKYRQSKDKILTLAENFLAMTQALHEQSLAHGDLQHGNILVDKNHQLFLVDYDSFYCPQLKGEEDTVTGLPDYQHPARMRNKVVSEKLDYFSELVIYLSILAIAEEPSLVEKYNVEDADRLLFSKEDYEDIKNSELYRDVAPLGEQFKDLFDIIDAYLKETDIDNLSPFNELLLANKVLFTASSYKAIRNKQTININWNVPFNASVTLSSPQLRYSETCELKGKFDSSLKENTDFCLSIEAEDGQSIKKCISIKVFDECTIDFRADKYYIYPSIPVVLSWKVTNAKTIELDDKSVENEGTKVVEPEKATVYVLRAEDEFGIKEKRIDIQMLPVPQVKALFVPTPKIENNLSVTIQQPRYNVNVKLPEINIDWIKTEVPRVKSLTDLGLNVELSPPIPKFNLMRLIRRVFNHIIKK